ncbi:MAG: hypothetical protein HY562_00475 [Ignavibacteriales bacterium]|nr:hypothetical protein [Ignavibacteriales bacterium]
MQPYLPVESINQFVEGQLTPILKLLEAVGKTILIVAPLTMVLIQMVKVPLRRFFHKRKISSWLSGFSYPILPTTYLLPLAFFRRFKEIDTYRKAPRDEDEPIRERIDQLVRLSTAGNSYALFQLSIEQLCGQLLAAVQTIMNDPARYRLLLNSIVGEQRLDSAMKDDIDTIAPSLKVKSFKAKKSDEKKYLAARSRIHSAIQRSIDALQISAGIEWRAWMKFAATVLSGLIIVLTVSIATMPVGLKVMLVLVVAPVAGYASSILRDAIAVIEKLRS